MDLDTLADLMGHKDTRMTRRDARIEPKHLASAISQIEKSYGEISTNLEQSKERELPDIDSSLLIYLQMHAVPQFIATVVSDTSQAAAEINLIC